MSDECSEKQLDNVNAQLSQLQAQLRDLTSKNDNTNSPQSTSCAADVVEQVQSIAPLNLIGGHDASPSPVPYLGESSFEAHSQQTTQVLESTLNSSPISNADPSTPSALQSLRDLLREKSSCAPKNFNQNLPMMPIQTALRVLRLIDGKSLRSPISAKISTRC